MSGYIWEFFGYRAEDNSKKARKSIEHELCPYLDSKCTKHLSDGSISGVCSIKPIKSEPVICCPNRLYANSYKVLRDVSKTAFMEDLEFVAGQDAVQYAIENRKSCVAVFGKYWGGELRLPQKAGKGAYFVDWVLAKLSKKGELEEFVAVEVQTIDTTGNYRNGIKELKSGRKVVKTTVGLNWENVSKRILPQLIYKGQVLQREELCKKGLFFICPEPVYDRIAERLGGKGELIRYTLQPASITFAVYNHEYDSDFIDGSSVPIVETMTHTTTVYKVQEAFNNVTLPDENVYKNAILKALGKE